MKLRFFLFWVLSAAMYFEPNAGNAISPLSAMSDKIPETFNTTPEVFIKKFFINAVPDINENKLGLIAGVIDNSQEISIEALEEKPVPDKILKRFIAKGEYSTGTFALECLKEQSEIKISVSELKGISGDSIKVENLKIFRVINHRQNPAYSGDMLISSELKNIHSGAVLQYCLFINVPENTKAGNYAGEIRISVKDGSIQIPVKLRVMDFTLPETGAAFGTFLTGHFFYNDKTATYGCWSPEFHTADNLDKLFRFWKTRKFNSPVLCHYYPKWINHDGKETADFSTLRIFAESMKKIGLSGPLCLDTRFFAWDAETKEKMQPPIKAEESYSKVIRELVTTSEKEKWPEIRYFPEEEIGNPSPIKFKTYTRFWKILREACGGKDYIIDNEIGYGRKSAVDRGNTDGFKIMQYNSWDEDALKKAKDAGRSVWGYNYGFSRSSFGFLQQKLGATGYHQWAEMWYSPRSSAQPYNRVFSLPVSDGMISSVQYERAYEGINDYAHCHMLKTLNRELIEKNLKEIAQKNEETISEILKDIPVENAAYGVWAHGASDAELNVRRWALAIAIENTMIKLGKNPSLQELKESGTLFTQTAPAVKKSIQVTNNIIMAPMFPADSTLGNIKYSRNSTGGLKMRLCDEIRLKSAAGSPEEHAKLITPAYTCAWVAYNQNGIFITASLNNHTGRWLAKFNDGDGSLWKDDCMEFFFQLPGDESKYQLIVNGEGKKIMLYPGKNQFESIEVSTKYLNPENKHAGSYEQVIFIPWKIFGLSEMPKPDTFWKLNIARGFNSISHFYSWGRVMDSFGESDKWGTLMFAGKSNSSVFAETVLSSCLPGMNSVSGKIKLPEKYKNDSLTIKIFRSDGSISAELPLLNANFKITFNVPVLRKNEIWQLALIKSENNTQIGIFEIPLTGIRKSVDVIASSMKVISGDDLKLRIHANVSSSDAEQRPVLCMKAVSENNKTIELPRTNLKSGGENIVWINTGGLDIGKWKIYLWLDKMGGADENSSIEFQVLPSPYADH